MASGDDILKVLQSIDAKISQFMGGHAVKATETRTQAPGFPRPQAPNVAAVAPDSDLDGPYGDPEIRAKDPNDWKGDPMKGRRMSACPPEYLDLVADRLEYFAGKEVDEKKAGWNRKDASRARGWAARLRSGYTPKPMTADEIPFNPDTQMF